jgi:E3 ubiquitin-protein ligase HERC1
MFWRVFESLTEEERTLYLKFVWGRSRLPFETDGLRDSHTLTFYSDKGDKDLPEAHTCFFSLDYPSYSTDEICKKMFTIAITMCGEIDGDGSVARYDDNGERIYDDY